MSNQPPIAQTIRRALAAIAQFLHSPYSEILTLLGILFGGMLVAASGGQFWMLLAGGTLVSLGILPPVFKGIAEDAQRNKEDLQAGRREVASATAFSAISDAAVFIQQERRERVKRLTIQTHNLMQTIHQSFYDADPAVRVTVYRLNDNRTELSIAESPVGRQDAARNFTHHETRGRIAISNLTAPDNHSFYDDTSDIAQEWQVSDRPYKQFVTLPIRSDTKAYGMLTVDSAVAGVITSDDGKSLEIFASTLAFYMAAAERGKNKPKEDRS